jgi:predicted Rossmann fold nucleotide-binding protein DprA/Smf involved in DNA uptake
LRSLVTECVLRRSGALQAEQRNLRAAAFAGFVQEERLRFVKSDEAVRIDDIVKRSGLNLSEVLATLFDLERKGIVRQTPSQQFA